MSLYPVLWAVDHAPVRDAEERAILIALVIKGDFDGLNCFRSYASLAEKARVDAKTAGRRCREMEARGILKRQEEHRSKVWLAIPEENRPVIWEVMIPAEWWSAAQLADINDQRAALGRPPLTPQNRPAIAPAPPKKTRADKGTKRPKKGAEVEASEGHAADPGTTSPRGEEGTCSPYPGDFKSVPQGLEVPQPSETPSETPSENNSAVADAVGSSAGGFASAASSAGAAGESGEAGSGCAASGTPKLPTQRKTSRKPATTKTRPRRESAGFETVRAAIPAAVAAPGTRLYPGLHRAINDLLDGGPGIPRRSPEQVIARLNRRWFGENADVRSAADYRGCDQCTGSGCPAPRRSEESPYGCDRIRNRSSWLAAAILAQDCPDPGCEDGQIIDGGACRACAERHAERREAAAAVAAAAARWEAETREHAVVTAWEEARAAEEHRYRQTLAVGGMHGQLLDHRVASHMAGWRERNPRPQKPRTAVLGGSGASRPGTSSGHPTGPQMPAQRRRTVVCPGCDQGHRTDADDDMCPTCREEAIA
ncbi:hypothetical protein ACH4Q7_22440 [Streptomyces roseolus]|uniref:hypothetical protein n=1 Tax=Streptomyces roseolus TaxID=67358 RepID=UPI0037B017DB